METSQPVGLKHNIIQKICLAMGSDIARMSRLFRRPAQSD